jgi:hypothetical protein
MVVLPLSYTTCRPGKIQAEISAGKGALAMIELKTGTTLFRKPGNKSSVYPSVAMTTFSASTTAEAVCALQPPSPRSSDNTVVEL